MVGNFTSSPNGYPLLLPYYFIYRTDIQQNCTQLRELFEFMYWTKLSDEALDLADALGFAGFNDVNNDRIVDLLKTSTCGGNVILHVELLPSHQGSAFTFYIVISLLLLGIAIILGALWQYFNKSRCSKVVILYQIILLIGITMTYISIVFWYNSIILIFFPHISGG